ncbi:hypothetical protein HHK36_010460 [Tetracentron sinense]|uniref:Homeobox domain-containing protein n=1 Tax=Tetracentron sinense TaxID=13715 RepID=A0A835DJ62_TETSI|nr:hypothetical protein HHK36_010460 [Tetracentron sinense]
MTDEQLELLRRQISAYAAICDKLVEMHKAITAQQDLAAVAVPGMRLGNLYCDSLMTSAGHKITARQRWTPTPVQLQVLERIFEQGNGTPSKQKIKEITSDLMQHGQISETNVYNWFQNRRARSKRKQLGAVPNSAESEVETDIESPEEMKAKPENIHSHDDPAARAEELCFQSPEISSELHSLDAQCNKAERMFPSDDGSKSSGSLGHISFYESVLSNPSTCSLHYYLLFIGQPCNLEAYTSWYWTQMSERPDTLTVCALYEVIEERGIDQLIGKMEVPGSFNPYQQGEGYDMI